MIRYDLNSAIEPWKQAMWLSMMGVCPPPLSGEDMEILEDDEDDYGVEFAVKH